MIVHRVNPLHIVIQKLKNILKAVVPEKDGGGFHPLNISRLASMTEEPLFALCTPKGCVELLHRYNIPIKDKIAVVIGRSRFVGKPAALLLEDPKGHKRDEFVGDICYKEASKVASAIAPVPGGVGPMTIAMLLSNTLLSAKRINDIGSLLVKAPKNAVQAKAGVQVEAAAVAEARVYQGE